MSTANSSCLLIAAAITTLENDTHYKEAGKLAVLEDIREELGSIIGEVLKEKLKISGITGQQRRTLFSFLRRQDVFTILLTVFEKRLIFQQAEGFATLRFLQLDLEKKGKGFIA